MVLGQLASGWTVVYVCVYFFFGGGLEGAWLSDTVKKYSVQCWYIVITRVKDMYRHLQHEELLSTIKQLQVFMS